MAILSEAVVTEGEALGISMLNSCLEGSTSYQTKYIARYCLTDSSPHASNPGTVSRVTTATLSTASRLVFNCFAKPENCLFPVYRLEEDGDLWKKVVSVFRFCC